MHFCCNLKKWLNASSIAHGVQSSFLFLVYKNLPNLSSPPALALNSYHFSHLTQPGAEPKHSPFKPSIIPLCLSPAATPGQSPCLHLCPEKTHLCSRLNWSTASSGGYHWAPHRGLDKGSTCLHTCAHTKITVLVTAYCNSVFHTQEEYVQVKI